MQPSQSYPSDLSEARWELIRPTLETWRQARAGIRKPTHDLRTLMNAILYVDRTGIPWRYLPHDFPPHQTVYGYFARWEADGIFDQLTSLLRGKVRQAEGRASQPSACLIDNKAVEHAAQLGIDLEIVQRDPTTRGFHVQPRRWVIERTLGWLMHHRRLARDYETHPHRSAAMIQPAAINLMTRRLTHEAAPNWRDAQPNKTEIEKPNAH
ncbi:transposase [Streptomyces argenteolus]|uniref:Transposase n=1 Tax=Streptomyces argenteolus TaxID=67274 RepID=A0ABW6X574_9ACTN